jgi:pyruvate dehydrogenase E2 component (dihydrolipoamide acetyltransferase)
MSGTNKATTYEVMGLGIAVEDRGRGGPPMIFLHGWGGGREDAGALMDAFAGERRVVSFDAPGHGDSDPSPFGYAIETRAKGLGKLVETLGLDRPVLVVHSQGGLGAEAVVQNPGTFSGLVTIDAPFFAPPEVRGAFEGLLGALRSPHWQAAIRGMADQVAFLPSDDPAVKDQVITRMVSMAQEVAADTWAAFLAHDPAPALAKLDVPMLQIEATMPSDRAALLAANPRIEVGRVVGSGHFAQRIVPDQVAAMIRRFVALRVAA